MRIVFVASLAAAIGARLLWLNLDFWAMRLEPGPWMEYAARAFVPLATVETVGYGIAGVAGVFVLVLRRRQESLSSRDQ